MFATPPAPAKPIGIVLACEGLGDCLYSMAVIRKLKEHSRGRYRFDLFTHHPQLFAACPYVENVYSIGDAAALRAYPNKTHKLFELDKLPHGLMDTFDFVSVPLGLGGLSFREKRLEYFPVEADTARPFDVVINTSMTWRARSWSMENWQRLANALLERGFSVAVVGKDVTSAADGMTKRSAPLAGAVNLVNALSLDQTYFTIGKARLFVSCQNGLSVLAGATDTEIVVLDMSIEWSKRAIYRNESPFYKVTYVKGNCGIYCASGMKCPLPDPAEHFKCVPTYDAVEAAVLAKLA